MWIMSGTKTAISACGPLRSGLGPSPQHASFFSLNMSWHLRPEPEAQARLRGATLYVCTCYCISLEHTYQDSHFFSSCLNVLQSQSFKKEICATIFCVFLHSMCYLWLGYLILLKGPSTVYVSWGQKTYTMCMYCPHVQWTSCIYLRDAWIKKKKSWREN